MRVETKRRRRKGMRVAMRRNQSVRNESKRARSGEKGTSPFRRRRRRRILRRLKDWRKATTDAAAAAASSSSSSSSSNVYQEGLGRR